VRLADSRRRLRAAVICLALLLSLFGGRLLQLQGLDATAYATEAAKGRLTTVTIPATRGTITDRNGVALAATVDAFDITADQTLVQHPRATAAALAPVLRLPAAALEATLSGTRRFVYVAKGVSPDVWRRVRDLNLSGTDGLPGIFGEPTSRRTYPAGTVGANLVGFVGADGHGLGGVEYALDKSLAGTDGKITYERGPGGRRIPTGETVGRDAVPGRDVALTIDRDIQWMAQQEIAAKVKETGAKSGTVIVMDPRTGDLLAVATAPTFDPANPGAAPEAARGNRALTEAYEPGSTGKVITASALIENGAVTPDTPIDVPNRLRRAGKTFKDFHDHPTQKLTYTGTLAKSSNIGTILAAEKLGLPRLYPYLKAFGVGTPTGLGLPGEARGAVLPPSRWSGTTGYTMAFGQGYSVNAVQMASVFATVANYGVRVAPRLVAARAGADGTMHATAASPRTRVIRPATAQTVRLMLETVLGKGGTAPLARIAGYRVAGKTGTAQRFDPACSCYRGFTMSFIGMAPVDKPRLVVAVTLQAPKSGIGGGSTGGPVFRDVMSFALQTLHIPPTGTRPPGLRIERN
jgi:cell division protein FtsI (penicillin-binding protein 3)